MKDLSNSKTQLEEPQAQSLEPQAQSLEPQAQSLEPQAESLEPQAFQYLKAQLLAVLFAAGRPVSADELASLAVEDTLVRCFAELEQDLQGGGSGIQIERVAGGWRLVVHPIHLGAVEQVLRPVPPRLSKAALEVLAIVAYHQPITRAEVEALRGKSTEGVLDGLLERELLRVVGEKDTVGHPKLYATTERFLEVFGLENLQDLPTIEEGPVLLLRS